MPNEFIPIMSSLVEAVQPQVSDNVFTHALNMRLGTEGLNISEVAAKAAKQDMTLQ